MLRESGAGVEQDLEPAEETLAQRRVVAQVGQQHLKAFRHVEVDRRCDLAQVSHGCLDGAGHRLAFVDIERAAIDEHQSEIMVAAERVVPRRPLDQDRRFIDNEGKT